MNEREIANDEKNQNFEELLKFLQKKIKIFKKPL